MTVHDLTIVLHMLYDLFTGGDPTLPAGHNNLWPIAWLLARIYDLLP